MGGHTVAFSFNTNIFPKAAYLFGGLFGHYKSTSNYRFGGLFITFNLQTNDALPLILPAIIGLAGYLLHLIYKLMMHCL